MKIKRLHLENFRGVRDATYEFGDKTRIKGRNGIGKSTICSAWLWLMVDRDVTLISNPPIRTIGAIDEVVTTVTADLDCGKPVQIQKTQKLKRSKTGTVALTNSYMVNSVPKSEKQFKESMEELGVNFDKFLPCSHPGVLLSGINNKKERTALRNMLFEMASDITDLDVVKDDPELIDIGLLLQDYKAEEIEAMQNNTLRVIRENYGKEGEILRAKIEGLEAAKIEVDAATVAKDIEDLSQKANEITSHIQDRKTKLKNIQSLSEEYMEKKFRLNDLKAEVVRAESKKRSAIETEIMQTENKILRMSDDISRIKDTIQLNTEVAEESKAKAKKNTEWLENYKKIQFDESTAICPTCGQKLPPEGVDESKRRFEEKKQGQIDKAVEIINRQENEAVKYSADAARLELELSNTKNTYDSLEKNREELAVQLKSLGDVVEPDMSQNAEYQKLLKEVNEFESLSGKKAELDKDINILSGQLEEVLNEMSIHRMKANDAKNNDRIDGQIAKLREDQVNYEQKKANAEMILHQLKVLNMRKNELLQDSVNSHFNLISWKLWDVLKNGEYRDTCIPMINGKAFGESMNTGLETMAKIDAMNGIQRFFKLDYPIILDNAEHLDSESIKKLETDHQLILLTVTDDERMVIEND